jgi:hypothetical protein
VIVGGESGHGARPFNVAWAQDLIRQCREADVACFVKQLGEAVESTENPPSLGFTTGGYSTDGHGWRWHLSDRKGGDLEEWPEDLRVRQFPAQEGVSA